LGVIIADNWFEIYGNSSGNYTNLKFPISYTAAGNADSIILGILCTDIRHMTTLNPASYLIVDNIRFSGTSENVPDNDFESFDNANYFSLDNWYYSMMNGPNPVDTGCTPLTRTTDAQHGNYAVVLQSCLFQSDTQAGVMSTSRYWNSPLFSVQARHKYLTGYYKFFPQNNDTMSIICNLYKNHNLIGASNFQTNIAATNYTPFCNEIIYNDILMPDSGQIFIQTYRSMPHGNSVMYIDNLNFDGYLSGIKDPVLTKAGNVDFNVYPNPFSDLATIAFSIQQDENVTVRLFDLSGKQVALLVDGRYYTGEYKINLSASGLSKGFYICVINTEAAVYSKKLIIY
jgi:hypothetical protein